MIRVKLDLFYILYSVFIYTMAYPFMNNTKQVKYIVRLFIQDSRTWSMG